MTTDEPTNPEPGPDATVDDLHADIEATRRELGETVEALTAKLDVKQQARQRVTDTKDLIADKAHVVVAKGSELSSQVAHSATDDAGLVRPRVSVSMVALIAVMVGLVIWKNRR